MLQLSKDFVNMYINMRRAKRSPVRVEAAHSTVEDDVALSQSQVRLRVTCKTLNEYVWSLATVLGTGLYVFMNLLVAHYVQSRPDRHIVSSPNE